MKPSKININDSRLAHIYVLYARDDRYPIADDVEAIGLYELAQELMAIV